MEERGQEEVEVGRREGQGVDVDDDEADAGAGGQLLGPPEADFGEVDGDDVPSTGRQPAGVAALAGGQFQGSARGGGR